MNYQLQYVIGKAYFAPDISKLYLLHFINRRSILWISITNYIKFFIMLPRL